jgi:hypothetical protein
MLYKAGCKKIYKEKQSAVKERPELEEMMNILRSGDMVIVWKLDRLGRSLKHLVDLMSVFKEKQVEFISLNDSRCAAIHSCEPDTKYRSHYQSRCKIRCGRNRGHHQYYTETKQCQWY